MDEFSLAAHSENFWQHFDTLRKYILENVLKIIFSSMTNILFPGLSEFGFFLYLSQSLTVWDRDLKLCISNAWLLVYWINKSEIYP